MENKIFAYVRVSSVDQNIDRQIGAIKEYCKNNELALSERDIFIDKKSGKDFERESYKSLKYILRKGDTLIIKELDRLGRNKEEVKNELQKLHKKQVYIRILNIPTTLISINDENKWVFDMVNNILIEVLSAIAEEERITIRKRQEEGIKSAKKKGVKFGRPKAQFPENFIEVYIRWKNKEIKGVEAMELMNLKKSTFYKLVRRYENSKQV